MARPFSQRYGHVKVEDILQVEGINENTRTALWSCLYSEILTKKYFDNVAEKIMSSFGAVFYIFLLTKNLFFNTHLAAIKV